MRKLTLVIVVLFALGAVGTVYAQSCHEEGGGGCDMQNCPGAGLKMMAVDGGVTYIAPEHNFIKVKKGEKTLILRVHTACPNKAKLMAQITKLKKGQPLKGSYYVKDGKEYLCTIAGDKDAPKSCH